MSTYPARAPETARILNDGAHSLLKEGNLSFNCNGWLLYHGWSAENQCSSSYTIIFSYSSLCVGVGLKN